MPLDNLAKNHIPDAVKDEVEAHLNAAIALLKPYCANLTEAERRRFRGLKLRSKSMVEKVLSYRKGSPDLSSPDVDWDEMDNDWATRKFMEASEMKAKIILRMCSSQRIVNDRDCLVNALTDYRYTVYRAASAGSSSFTSKHQSLKPFMPRSGKKKGE